MEMNQIQAIQRIIDADLNRLGEGLRVLEEIARFMLEDASLAITLKTLRHELAPQGSSYKEQFLSAREVENDVGMNIQVGDQGKPRELMEIVVANARRAQESLRVLEELSKMPGSGLRSGRYSNARFQLYTLEKELFGRLLRRDKAVKLRGLYAIIDTDSLGHRSHLEAAGEVLAGGVSLIQLRDKHTPKGRLVDIAVRLKQLCLENGALLIINDYLDICLACGADGLHLGQTDLPVAVARKQLPIDKLIGCSVTDVIQAEKAAADGADYIACGAIFATSTKADCAAIGCRVVADIKRMVNLPLVAIGGIKENNVMEVLSTGADCVAIVSAILSADSITLATRKLVDMLSTRTSGDN
jgi:thiamine-phosphate pyrophosphorylase